MTKIFEQAFAEPDETYYYLNIIDKTKNDDKKALSEILSDISVSPDLKKRLEPLFHKDDISFDGAWVGKSKSEMVRYFIETYCKELTSDADFMTQYHEWLNTLGLPNAPDYELAERYYDNLNRYDYVIRSLNHRFRYYNSCAHDFDDLLSVLGSKQYENTEISTMKLFRDFPELMKRYDIRDEYECHNLLRKLRPDEKYHVKFGRMPIIEIGEVNRQEQLLSILRHYGALRTEDLAELYDEKYGVDAATVQANFIVDLEAYRCRGGYSMEGAACSEIPPCVVKHTSFKAEMSDAVSQQNVPGPDCMPAGTVVSDTLKQPDTPVGGTVAAAPGTEAVTAPAASEAASNP